MGILAYNLSYFLVGILYSTVTRSIHVGEIIGWFLVFAVALLPGSFLVSIIGVICGDLYRIVAARFAQERKDA